MAGRPWTEGLIALGLLGAPAAADACAPQNAGEAAAAVQGMYDAAMARSDTFFGYWTPGAYAFDGGHRLTPQDLMSFARASWTAGKVYRWKVTEPAASFDCDTALVTWVNRGSRTAEGAAVPLTWLESAVLRYDAGRWRIAFFHSTEVPKAAN